MSQVKHVHTSINVCWFILSTFSHTHHHAGYGAEPRGDVGFLFRSNTAGASSNQLTQFEQPALSVRVEESVREVVAVVLGDLERLVLDALIQVLG